MRIGVAGWSPTEHGSIAGCDPRLVAWPPPWSGPWLVSGRPSPIPHATLCESGTRSGLRRVSGSRVQSGTWSGARSGTRGLSGTQSEPPGASGLQQGLLSMIGAAHVFVIATLRPRGLRTAMMSGGPSNRQGVVSVAGAAGVPLVRHLQSTPWRQYATSCSSRWGLSEWTTRLCQSAWERWSARVAWRIHCRFLWTLTQGKWKMQRWKNCPWRHLRAVSLRKSCHVISFRATRNQWRCRISPVRKRRRCWRPVLPPLLRRTLSGGAGVEEVPGDPEGGLPVPSIHFLSAGSCRSDLWRGSLRAVSGAGPRGSLLLPASVGGADQHPPACEWRGERDRAFSAGGSGSSPGWRPEVGRPPLSPITTHPAIQAGVLPDALPGWFTGRGEAPSPHLLVDIGGFVSVKEGCSRRSEGPRLPDEGLGDASQGRFGCWFDNFFYFFVCRCKSAGTHPGPHPGGQCDGASWGLLGRISPPPLGCTLPPQPGDRLRRPTSGPWSWGTTNSLRGAAHSTPVRDHCGDLSATAGSSHRPRSHAHGGDVAGLARQTLRLPVEGLTRTPPVTPARRQVERGRRGRLGVTRTFDPKPKVWRDTAPHSAAGGSETLEFHTGMEQFIRSVVRKVNRIELDSSLNLSPVPIPMQLSHDSEKAQSLRQEIISLLDKRAIEELELASLSPGFYSRIFLVRKKDGDWRLVFDLKSLNQFVRKETFKMTTPRVVTNALHHRDWVVSVDLKHAYFHIPIHKKSRHLLRFAVETDDGLRVFQFRALPFGLTSAPRVFTKVILPIGHLAHMQAVCLLPYLDDWILRSTDRSLLAQQTNWLLSVMRRVGLVLNVPKSHLVPTQRLTHIGVEYHLDEGLMFPPRERVLKIESKVSLLLSVRAVTAYFWLSLLGLMSSAMDAIPLGRLHLRPLQFYLLAHWAPASRNLAPLIPVKHNLLDHHLRWWLDRECTRAGMLLDIPGARAQLFTDASESGWGRQAVYGLRGRPCSTSTNWRWSQCGMHC